ncbi:MAG: pilus assembly protein PilM [Agathobacter sp.]|nr:pilus assembly protein PilM [Agathobacter sp.]
MAKKVISIETGIQWTKVALVDYRKKNPPVHEAFAFRTPEHAVEDGYIRDKDSLARALKEELVRRQIVEKDVVFTLSSSKVVTREVMIPYVKDNKIKGIIDTQSRDYFPMDISGYTISYSKMDVVEDDGKKQLKLLLVAIPDNLLGNYVSFAQLAGLKVETFDYIGNGCIQLMCDSFVDNAMIIQLEEQATVISILENKKLAFQRVTPYGYGATISTVVDHPILGIDDEERAFDFLLEHNVIFNKPSMPDNGDPAQQAIDQAQADEAYEDLAESLRYHLRIANTALDYYQNQVKQEFVGNVYLVGDGSRFAGIHKLFAQELPLPLQKIDFAKIIDLRNQNGVNDKKKAGKKEHQNYTDPVLEESSNTRQPRAATPVGFLSVIGAAVHPLDAKPKEMQAADSKKNDLHTAYVLLAGSLLLSLLLILGSSVRQLIAHSEHRKLTDQLESLAYVQQTYDESSRVQQEEQVYVTIDDATRTKNEYLLPLIEQLEAELPSAIKVTSMQTDDNLITLNMTADRKITVGQMLLNFQNVTLLTDPSIPSMSEQTDEESGSSEWTYTVNAYYADVQESEEQADE